MGHGWSLLIWPASRHEPPPLLLTKIDLGDSPPTPHTSAPKQAIRTEDLAVVVEGYFDVIKLHDAGIRFAVGVLGTAITIDQLQLCARYLFGGVDVGDVGCDA